MNDNKEYCPFCNADLQGEPIPKEIQHHYGANYGSRKIGISSLEEDRVTTWECPDCHQQWVRD